MLVIITFSWQILNQSGFDISKALTVKVNLLININTFTVVDDK